MLLETAGKPIMMLLDWIFDVDISTSNGVGA